MCGMKIVCMCFDGAKLSIYGCWKHDWLVFSCNCVSGSCIWGFGIFTDGENEVLHINLWYTIGQQFGTAKRHLMRSAVHFWLLRDGALWFICEHEPLILCSFMHGG